MSETMSEAERERWLNEVDDRRRAVEDRRAAVRGAQTEAFRELIRNREAEIEDAKSENVKQILRAEIRGVRDCLQIITGTRQ